MVDSKPSPSAREYLKVAGQSLRDGALSPVNDAVELIYGPDPMKSGICVAASATLAVIFPFPFFVAGVLSVANAAANGVKKNDAIAPPAPAPAAG